jgi:hypothetical protein
LFNNSGKAKVIRLAIIHFFIGSYHDYADSDVVPMQACSLLSGRSGQYDTDALHHGRTNTYTLMHKGKKFFLLPLMPTEIVKYNKELGEISKNDHALDPPVAASQEIKLKGGALLPKIYLNAENYVDAAPCRTMLCKHVSF